MATVTKNFRIKSGLIVEGTTGTINGQNILTETGGNAYILNLVGGATLVKSVDAGTFAVDGAGNLTVKPNTFDSYGAAAAAQAAAEATASADATSKASAAQSAAITAAATDATTKVAAEAALRVSGDAASVSTAAADATSKANAAQAAAEATAAGDATSKANAAQAAAEATASADATTKANAAQAAAEATAASALSSAISTEVSNRNTAISTAVDSLVDGAPALLNTLNELAAAINDDANYTTTLTSALATKASEVDLQTVRDVVNTKASQNYVSSEITDAKADATTKVAAEAALRVSGDAASVATASADATTKANAAQAAAEATASADATSKANAAQAAAEATAAAANTAQQAGTTKFTALNLNDEAKQIAVGAMSPASIGTAYEWAKADYRSAKFLVKIDNGTHNEVSEVLITLDSSDNVAITEYAIVGTNGSRGTITADVSGSNVRLRITPVDNCYIKVTGTLIK
jgi:chemotaxis protein histidine kinase CheA